ncbi:MAG TPA: SpoIIE family protein phosphatase [Actinomycetota bacterium]|nr:SpoIIE family protein phosphatase [Actinomycetota bacterium]
MLRRALPRGQGLPEDVWGRRHRAILILLWGHAVVVPIYALVQGYSPGHAALESLIIPAAAVAAMFARSRAVRTMAASFGLLSSSAVLVHLSGGLIEMHFHFFVMVAVVALYQDWAPFLVAIGYVAVHHGLIGSIDPESVFNHPAALANPWRWAGVHAFFIAGISAASLVTWRLNETFLAERREAEERLREGNRVVETLNEVGKTLAAELDMRSVVQHVTDAATELTNAQFGAFFYNIQNDNGESYMLYTISGVDPVAFEQFPMPRNTEIFAPTFAGEGVVRLDDVTADPRYGKMAPHFGMPEGHLPVRSYLAVPVRSRDGSVLGGLFFGHGEPARFGPIEEQLAAGIAAHAAIAIDNANLYQSERRARATAQHIQHRVEIMAEASRALSSSLELETTLAEFARVVAPAMADNCEVYLLDESHALQLAAYSAPRDALESYDGKGLYRPDLMNEFDPVARAIATRAPAVVESFTTADIERAVVDLRAREVAKRLAPTSAVAVPLLQRDEVIGALSVGTNSRSNRRLGHADVSLIEELGRRVAGAVENARLFATKRTAADTLQHSLLPEKLPDIPGMTFAARYVPGGPGVEVGGDWYDVVPLRDGSLVLAMGDVVGRGVQAASLMGQLRNALRAYAFEGTSPVGVLTRLNDLLYDIEAFDNPMATLLYAVYEPETGTLRVANAGHPPPLVLDSAGNASFLETSQGVPIGALPSPRFTEALTTLEPNATLLLYTDGLVEDRVTTLERGLETLRVGVETAPSDLGDLCDWILERSPARDGCDDVAVLAIRTVPIGGILDLQIPAKPSSLKPLRGTLRRWLLAAGATEDETFQILVAASEACSNAIQHAGPGSEYFHFHVDMNNGVCIEVTDYGKWRLPRPSLGGRGIDIMRTFMDHLEIARAPGGTSVKMRRALQNASIGAGR